MLLETLTLVWAPRTSRIAQDVSVLPSSYTHSSMGPACVCSTTLASISARNSSASRMGVMNDTSGLCACVSPAVRALLGLGCSMLRRSESSLDVVLHAVCAGVYARQPCAAPDPSSCGAKLTTTPRSTITGATNAQQPYRSARADLGRRVERSGVHTCCKAISNAGLRPARGTRGLELKGVRVLVRSSLTASYKYGCSDCRYRYWSPPRWTHR
jgi:hypothetical protein